MSRDTATGDQEELQFKVDIVNLSMTGHQKYALILHCLEGHDIKVQWSYKKEGSHEWSVMDKVVFVKPGFHDVGGYGWNWKQKLDSCGALHKQTVSSMDMLFEQSEVQVDRLLVKLKIEEEKDQKEQEERREEAGEYASIQEDLIEDLSKMFISSETADIRLVCQGKKFPCHRSILAGRSSVFKTMFFGWGEYMECKDGQVIIEDFQPDEIEQFLSFVYSGECNFSKVDAWQILALADKYDMAMLNEVCCRVSFK